VKALARTEVKGRMGIEQVMTNEAVHVVHVVHVVHGEVTIKPSKVYCTGRVQEIKKSTVMTRKL